MEWQQLQDRIHQATHGSLKTEERLLFALFPMLNKIASVLDCFKFCSCSLRLEGMFSHEDVKWSWPDILTLIRGLNKILQAMTLNHTETQALSIVKLK
ncbi:hypothetical protein FQN60_018538 [Etheostoma spectabile]|uniref:Uncharacterized protein n=1 Tax=Etheostoma spectabile TaxID=54343 RepID=A0A5J5DIJ5_9PERO|nr:hypothetical protein FQN60_018538 [Etheostoma spectabile]